MSAVPDRRTVWTARYRELLSGFTEALGGEAITPTRKAMAQTLAVLQCQLLTLSDRFANSQGGSADEMLQFLKISSAITELLAASGLTQILQQPIADPREAEEAEDFLRKAFEGVMGVRLEEESRGIFRDRDNNVIDISAHVTGCACEPCQWRRDHPDIIPASPAINRIPAAQKAPAIVAASSPPAPQLRVVPHPQPQPAPPPKAEPAPVQSTGDLMEQRRQLTDHCDDLRRQISQLADRALVDADARSRRDRLQADLTLLESDLSRLNATINQLQAASQSTTAKFLEWSAGGGGRSSYDMSPGWDWPRLR
jgi:hypothetical protein